MSTQPNQESGLEKKTLSNRKVEANRRNASKSTGPKTSRGKEYSSRNAIKHGLFMMGPFMFDSTNRENIAQYKDLIGRLSENYKPMGVAEELEVERIAVCWWKLGRAWRYENAKINAGFADIAIRYEQRMRPNTVSSADQARLVLLRKAQTEIESTDTISAELREQMFATDSEFRTQWESLEKAVKENSTEVLFRLSIPPSDAEQYADDPSFVLYFTTFVAIYMLEHKKSLGNNESLGKKVLKIVGDGMAIPPEEALGRILRAEAAAERSLNRAIDRLERLQRRRLGETVPAPVTVRLTR